MNKTFLTLMLGLVSIIDLQADKFLDAVAVLEAVGKRPRVTVQDILDFEKAHEELQAIVQKTDAKVIKAWAHAKASMLAKEGYTPVDEAEWTRLTYEASTRFSQNAEARAFYQSSIAPLLESDNETGTLFDDATLDRALAYYQSHFIDTPQHTTNEYSIAHRSVRIQTVLTFPVPDPAATIVHILAALDGSEATAVKTSFLSFCKSREKLVYAILGTFRQAF